MYLASYSIGSALGNTIAAGIWLNNAPGEFEKQMTRYGVTNTTVASYLYLSPGSFIVDYPVGTPERDAAIDGYAHVQRKLCIAGICIAALIFVVSLFLRNPYLGDEQTLPGAEGFIEPGHVNELPKRGNSEGEDGGHQVAGNDYKARHPTDA